MLAEPGKTYIGTVRVSSPERDTLALQLRLDHALASADPQPTSLPPSAILCVRALADPLPGVLGLDGRTPRPPPDWEAALHNALDRLVRAAARPARGSVPATAEAVLFADAGELLGCLASDWCAGRIGAHWWWKRLARDGDLRRAVLTAWSDTPQAIPAALAQLAARGEAVRFMRALAPHEAGMLMEVILRRYALRELRTALAPVLAAQVPATDGAPPSVTRLAAHPPSPWRAGAPEATEQVLNPAAETLLGLGLMLHRTPTAVRAAAFARQAGEWARNARAASAMLDTSARRDPHTAVAPPPEPPAVPAHHLAARNNTPPRRGSRAVTRDTPQANKKAGAVDVDLPAETHAPPPIAGGDNARAAKRRRTSLILARETPHGTAPSGSPHSLRPMQPAPALTEMSPTLGTTIQTRWGGLFYLLNVALALNLYADFTSPSERGLPLSPWDFLALVGERLVGRGLCDDPVWVLMAALAERAADDEPGATFLPDDAWRMPPDWLVPFAAPRIWSWRIAGERLLVTHPAGFHVLDVPLEPGNPLYQAQRETAAYAAIPFRLRRARPVVSDTRSARDRWLTALVEYLRARLRSALGAIPSRDVGRFVCAHSAEVTATATHVGIALSLYALPIEVRLAGLDRDPGWVPAAGRTITFSFA